jgi:5-formyltetrahydrofolate cyclo-ligase
MLETRDAKRVLREQVWARLRSVARPDSRYHWDFESFIPDFEGSDRATARVLELPEYHAARRVFVTPDNGLRLLREQVMRDGKGLLVTTYGIARGFVNVAPGSVSPSDISLAATMDGLDYLGVPVHIADLITDGPIDLLVTGASGVSRDGVRLGKGHGYFDLEWAMLREAGASGPTTPVVVVVHDCQLVEERIPADVFDVIGDVIVTPSGTLRVDRQAPQPGGIVWNRTDPSLVAAIPPLQELADRR